MQVLAKHAGLFAGFVPVNTLKNPLYSLEVNIKLFILKVNLLNF